MQRAVDNSLLAKCNQHAFVVTVFQLSNQHLCLRALFLFFRCSSHTSVEADVPLCCSMSNRFKKVYKNSTFFRNAYSSFLLITHQLMSEVFFTISHCLLSDWRRGLILFRVGNVAWIFGIRLIIPVSADCAS